MKITSTDELPRDATKREQHKPHEPPFGAAKSAIVRTLEPAPNWLF
jgi:hypothetical protein